MPLADGLRKNDYLVEYYEKAARMMTEFEERPERHDFALFEAARIICEALRLIAVDEEFWSKLGGLLEEAQENGSEISQMLNDIDSFIELEWDLLRKEGMSPEAALRLVSEMHLSMYALKELPTRGNLGLVRAKVSDARDACCGLEIPPKEHRTWWRSFRIIRASVAVLGSLAAIVVNGSTILVAGPVALVSVAGGVGTILYTVPIPDQR